MPSVEWLSSYVYHTRFCALRVFAHQKKAQTLEDRFDRYRTVLLDTVFE